MKAIPNSCPLCGGQITVTRLYCPECDTTYEGRFAGRSFSQLSSEQLDFLETFVRCEGKLNRMADELRISYPTLRNRLHELIRSMGYEPGLSDEAEGVSEANRLNILEDLESGKISADQALNLLAEKGD